MERRVLILTDGKAGHENQSKAFARALGCAFDLVEIHFKSAFHKALSYLFDRLGIHSLGLFKGIPDANSGYAAVLGTGSGTFYAAKSLARKLGVKCGVVLYPRGYRIATFDCVLAPAFDRPAPAPNVITIPVNLVASDEAFYATGTEAFRARHTPSEKPAVAVIVGGPNKCSTMSADWMKAQLERIFADTPDAEHWVTTSRRTPPEVEAVVDSFPFDYKLRVRQARPHALRHGGVHRHDLRILHVRHGGGARSGQPEARSPQVPALRGGPRARRLREWCAQSRPFRTVHPRPPTPQSLRRPSK